MIQRYLLERLAADVADVAAAAAAGPRKARAMPPSRCPQ